MRFISYPFLRKNSLGESSLRPFQSQALLSQGLEALRVPRIETQDQQLVCQGFPDKGHEEEGFP